jgi:predicted MFS family arabinose efflux permease
MRIDLICLVLAYVLSQFYRAFLAVLAPALQTDIGAGPGDLALASGIWFLTFALMQIPVGAALDSIGPRRTAVTLFALGGAGGAALFALAQTPLHLTLAMGLIGIGCSPILMAAYYIFARSFSPAVFATLAAAIIGFGSLGNIAGSAPLAWAVQTFGWRQTMAGLGGATLLIAAMLWITLQDPPRMPKQPGSVLDVLRLRPLWPVFAMMFVCYAPAAGLRALWAGPYAADTYGTDAAGIGRFTLIMGLAMVAGNFAYGPLDRWLGTRKWVVLVGNLGVVLGCAALALHPGMGLAPATTTFAMIGFCGSTFGLVIAHGRAFIPGHLIGRGVTLLNLFGIAGAGIAQLLTGSLHAHYGTYPPIFAYFGLITLAGLGFYLFAQDRTD